MTEFTDGRLAELMDAVETGNPVDPTSLVPGLGREIAALQHFQSLTVPPARTTEFPIMRLRVMEAAVRLRRARVNLQRAQTEVTAATLGFQDTFFGLPLTSEERHTLAQNSIINDELKATTNGYGYREF